MLCLSVGSLVGCSSNPAGPSISHVVLISLQDQSEAEALLADCDRLLVPIPSVTTYAAGDHIDTGRGTVQSDYDVGLVIGFDSPEGYATYVDHPRHVELVETWGPKFSSIRVYDIHDPQ